MLGKTFSVMIVVSFVCAVFTSSFDRMSTGIVSSLSDAVQLCISLAGIMCFWSGFINVLKKTGALRLVSKLLMPVLVFAYGKRAQNKEIAENLSASVSANILGLGNAALPFGIKTVKSLEKDNESKVARDETIMFSVLNTVPLQLVPTTLIVMRQNHGSENPFDVVPIIWLCLLLNNVFAIVVCKIFAKFSGGKR